MNIKILKNVALVFALVLSFSSLALAESKSNDKALYEAVLFQDPAKIKELVGKGADVNYKENGRPILGWAAQNGNVEIVELLLASKANPNIADDGVGHTPLMRAIDTQQTAIVLSLLKAKADPNAKTPDGETCLDMAVESRKPEIVKALIDAGADVKHVTADGDSPALKAAQDGMTESIEIIRILGKAGANMNASNAAYTPLSYAVEQGNKDLVQALLDAGADPNAKTQGGTAPISQSLDKPEILELLVKAKADPNVESTYGSTPLFTAIENGNKEAVAILLKAGADANKVNSSGTTPLELANQYSYTEIAELLKANVKVDSVAGNQLKEIPADFGNPNCTIVDAAKRQMELHGLLQAQVDAGKMSSEIFRTFGEDTKEYGELLTTDPPAACALLARLKVKYGV